MNIGVLGAGNVGSTLGRGWLDSGHDVVFGVRDPASPKAQAAVENGAGRLVSIGGAASHGEVVVLAVPYPAVGETLAAAGDLTGRVVVDTTNAVDWSNGPVVAVSPSAAETTASLVPGARVVKAFNMVGYEVMADPVFGATPADVYLAGDDPEARQLVASLAADLGFEAVDAGPLHNARAIENLAALWMYFATRGGLGRNVAFKLLRR